MYLFRIFRSLCGCAYCCEQKGVLLTIGHDFFDRPSCDRSHCALLHLMRQWPAPLRLDQFMFCLSTPSTSWSRAHFIGKQSFSSFEAFGPSSPPVVIQRRLDPCMKNSEHSMELSLYNISLPDLNVYQNPAMHQCLYLFRGPQPRKVYHVIFILSPQCFPERSNIYLDARFDS